MNDNDGMNKVVWLFKPSSVPKAGSRQLQDVLSCVTAILFVGAYIIVLIPYYSHNINQYSDYALTLGAYDYNDPQVAPGPDIEVIYGSPTLGVFAFWYVLCTARCLFFPLALFQSFTLLRYWHASSKSGKVLRVALLVAVLIVGILGFLNASKFASWLEL
jgi:hypothetical protein